KPGLLRRLFGRVFSPSAEDRRDAALREAERRERIAVANLVRCLFAYPGRSVLVPSSSLSWQVGTVYRLATSAYEDGAFHLLPIRADAGEDAGCDSAALRAHRRGQDPHIRGCGPLALARGGWGGEPRGSPGGPGEGGDEPRRSHGLAAVLGSGVNPRTETRS